MFYFMGALKQMVAYMNPTILGVIGAGLIV